MHTYRRLACALFVVLVHLADRPAFSQCETWEIDAYSDTENDAQFGLRVAIGDAWAASASVYDDTTSGADSGSVRILKREGSHWTEVQTLVPPPNSAGDWFGAGLAMDTSLLVVGSPNDDDQANNAGAVYTYRFTDGLWLLEQKIVASDGAMDDHFGSSIAVDGSTMVIGAPEADTLGSDAGAAYIFSFDGTSWSESAKLVATSFGGPGDKYGYSVDIEGNTVLAGAPFADVAANNSGAAYVMAKVFSTWLVQAELANPSATPSDRLGSAVALDANLALTGAPGTDGPSGTATNYGALLLFERTGSLWEYKDMIQASDASGEEDFGATCAISQDWMIVGAPFDDFAPCCDAGSVYLFERTASGSGWTENHKYVPCDMNPVGDHVGASVAIHGDRAMVGAPLHDIDAADSGSAYIIELQGGSWLEVERATSNGGLDVVSGGTQQILLNAGVAHAGNIYFLGGTASGTVPGVQVGAVTVPLNLDSYALFTLNHPNNVVLPKSFGFLDAQGSVESSFELQPGLVSTTSPLQLHHAFVLLDPVTLDVLSASAAEPLPLRP